MTNQKLKLWTCVGVATLLTGSGALADEQKDRHNADRITSGAHGGEGGEGGAALSYFAAGGEGGEGGEAGGSVSAARVSEQAD